MRGSATAPGDRFTLSAFVNNLLDTDYLNHSLPAANPAQGITGDTIAWADPRTYGVSFITRF